MNSQCESLIPPSPAMADTLIQEEPLHTSFSLSVLVPVYNERYLAETSLRRLLALKDNIIHSPEAIVVDDCSWEGTRKYHSGLCRTSNAWWCEGVSATWGKGRRCARLWRMPSET